MAGSAAGRGPTSMVTEWRVPVHAKGTSYSSHTGKPVSDADVQRGAADLPAHGQVEGDPPLPHLHVVEQEHHRPAALGLPVVLGPQPHPARHHVGAGPDDHGLAVGVHHPGEPAVPHVERPPVGPVALGAQDPLGPAVGHLDVGDDAEPAAEARADVLGHRRAPGAVGVRRPRRRARLHGDEAADERVLERQHLVAPRLEPPPVGELAHPLGLRRRHVVGLREVLVEVEERPVVVGEVAAALQQLLLGQHALRHVVGGRLPPVEVHRAGGDASRSTGSTGGSAPSPSANVSSSDAPSSGCCCDAVDDLRARARPPRRAPSATGRRRGRTAGARRPGPAMPRGQCTMSGVRVPPSQA